MRLSVDKSEALTVGVDPRGTKRAMGGDAFGGAVEKRAATRSAVILRCAAIMF